MRCQAARHRVQVLFLDPLPNVVHGVLTGACSSATTSRARATLRQEAPASGSNLVVRTVIAQHDLQVVLLSTQNGSRSRGASATGHLIAVWAAAVQVAFVEQMLRDITIIALVFGPPHRRGKSCSGS